LGLKPYSNRLHEKKAVGFFNGEIKMHLNKEERRLLREKKLQEKREKRRTEKMEFKKKINNYFGKEKNVNPD
jgi:hypothetical protein